jgi:hypothetical protein
MMLVRFQLSPLYFPCIPTVRGISLLVRAVSLPARAVSLLVRAVSLPPRGISLLARAVSLLARGISLLARGIWSCDILWSCDLSHVVPHHVTFSKVVDNIPNVPEIKLLFP